MTVIDGDGASPSSGGGLRFQILGPLAVWAGDRWLRMGGPGQRSLLAALLLRANEVVSQGQLVEAIWGEAPPRTANAKLQAHVSALRQLLGPALGRTDPRHFLATRPPGYVMIVQPDQLDLSMFELLAQEGHRLLGPEPARAAAKLQAALSLWRGRPLEGVDLGGPLGLEPIRLEERHFAVMEERIEAELRLGRHDELIAELEELTHLHPLRERLHGQLMVALYRSGRRAEALDAFRRARLQMVQELGLDPGRELQKLHRAILRADPELDIVSTDGMSEHAAARPEPFPICQLPAAIDDLTGRNQEMARLAGVLGTGSMRGSPAMPVAVVSGRAGVGKTALAVRAAHQLRSRYPDGQLYMSLQEAGQPVSSRKLLQSVLRTLGIDASGVPENLNDCSQLYRSRLSSRRVLVVLDDAANEAQVRFLMPGTPNCATLVTSRARLEGIEGAHRIDLGVLRRDVAVQLLGRVAGREWIGSDLDAATTIVELCGCLPLALRIVGAKLAARPHWSVARMAERLADERRRLDELAVGDMDVRASLMLSYRALTAQERRAFRLVGLLETPDFASWTVAALLDIDMERSEDLLDGLVSAWLVEASPVDRTRKARYTLHSLLRVLARERAHEEEPVSELEVAEWRLIAAHAELAERAEAGVPGMRRLGAGQSVRVQPRSASAIADAVLSDPLEWFAAERHGIVAAVDRARALGFDELACKLAASASPYFSLRGHYDEWQRTQELAIQAATEARNRAGEAFAHCWLGHYHLDRGDALRAEGQFERSRGLFAELQHLRGEAYALHGLGSALHGRGSLTVALRLLERSMGLFEALGDRQGQAWALFNLGACQLDRAPSDETTQLLQRSIELFDSLEDPLGKAYAMRTLGTAHRRLGRHELALVHLKGSLDLFVELADHKGQAITILSLGATYRRMGNVPAANACLQSSLGAFTELNCRFRVGSALYELGQLHQERGRSDEALGCYRHCLEAFRELGLKVWEARTLQAIGDVLAVSQAEAAQASRNEALTIFRDLGARETEDVVVPIMTS